MLAAAVVVSLCVGTSCAWAVSAPALRTGFLAGVSRPLVPATLPPLARLRARPLHSGWAAKLQTGIVGLPNVGKSTLFNALLQKQTAEAANFPFCTIEPNTGIVSVPDPRLEVLGKLSNSEKVIPATMEFTDIAGIVKGASEGAGLGNKFLANIRECDAIIHVVGFFVCPGVQCVARSYACAGKPCGWHAGSIPRLNSWHVYVWVVFVRLCVFACVQ